jgi:hypothetical protein
MKKFLFFFVSVFISLAVFAQVKSGDAQLDKRLAEYMQYNNDKNYEKIMDYMHPKLFSIVPRETLVSALRSAFESEEMAISMNDLGVTSVGGAFTSAGSAYRKVMYKMTLTMRFRDTAKGNDPEFQDVMLGSFKSAFPGKSVTFNSTSKEYIVKGEDILYAIHDQGKPWLFLGYKNDPDMIKKLFPKAVIDHFKML